MDFKQLQSFATVVECRSFTRAAERLYLSQPTITSHIQALEQELNRKLLIRTTKSLELTPKGQMVYEHACHILDLRDRMISECSEEGSQIIQLGASTIAASYILPQVLPRFGQMHPDTYFKIQQSDSQGVIDGLLGGIFDLGLLSGTVPDSLKTIPICSDRTILIAPVTDEYLALQQSTENVLPCLMKAPMILREKGSVGTRSIERCFEKLGTREDELTVAARVNDQETIKRLVAGGLGVSLISHLAARDFIAEKRLLAFELPFDDQRFMYLAYRKEYFLRPLFREFSIFLQRDVSSD